MKKTAKKIVIGWEEWVTFPALGLPAVKAKIDTGAKTSALHATDIKPFEKNGERFIRFTVHPIQKNREIEKTCEAPLVDYRFVTSSNGRKEKRYVISTEFIIGNDAFTANLTLTSRFGMSFRMLLGKEAMIKGKMIIDPSKKFLMGKNQDAKSLYLCDD